MVETYGTEHYRNIPISEAVVRIKKDVIDLARVKFRGGDFANPYCPEDEIEEETNLVKMGQAMIFRDEIQRLLEERICPCCGQPTRGDLDF